MEVALVHAEVVWTYEELVRFTLREVHRGDPNVFRPRCAYRGGCATWADSPRYSIILLVLQLKVDDRLVELAKAPLADLSINAYTDYVVRILCPSNGHWVHWMTMASAFLKAWLCHW
jgi:hypothetical protein